MDILTVMDDIGILDVLVTVSLPAQCLTAVTNDVHDILGQNYLAVCVAGFHGRNTFTAGNVMHRGVYAKAAEIYDLAIPWTNLRRTQQAAQHQSGTGSQRRFCEIQADQFRQPHQIVTRECFGLLWRHDALCPKQRNFNGGRSYCANT